MSSVRLSSGALLNCSFLAIWRFRVLMPAEVAPFCDQAMLALGLLSLAVAAVFIVRQTDFKRLLAYSSVEHMGLVIILFALASDPRVISAHIVFHSLTKMTEVLSMLSVHAPTETLVTSPPLQNFLS